MEPDDSLCRPLLQGNVSEPDKSLHKGGAHGILNMEGKQRCDFVQTREAKDNYNISLPPSKTRTHVRPSWVQRNAWNIALLMIATCVIIFALQRALSSSCSLTPSIAMAYTPGKSWGMTHLSVLAVADTGTGGEKQQEVADTMYLAHTFHKADLVVLAGDNIYPNGDMVDNVTKFMIPYKKLINAKVQFRAVLGNHDIKHRNGQGQLDFPLFNMKGRWYTFQEGPVSFFMLDTNSNADWPAQLKWLEQALANCKTPWRVAVGHHPIICSGWDLLQNENTFLLDKLGPLFEKYRVQLYLNGHEHHYERTRPRSGTTYMTVGAGGRRLRNVKPWRSPHSSVVAVEYSFAQLLWVGRGQLVVVAFNRQGRSVDRATILQNGALLCDGWEECLKEPKFPPNFDPFAPPP
eukprot:g1206.t1